MKTKQRLLTWLLMLAIPLITWAQYFESGTSKTGSVSKNVHDVWYTINLPEDGEVNLTLTPISNIGRENISIYAVVDGENERRAFAWTDGADGGTLTCPNLKPGIYKVKVNASPKNDKASGTYKLSYTFTAPFFKTDPTPNDTWDDCPQLEDGVQMHGHLGYSYSSADTDTKDWFKIEVPKDGKLTFEARSTATLTFGMAELCALNAEGTDVQRRNAKWLDNPDSTLVWEVPDVATGTYYFYMPRRAGYGVYHLTYRFTPSIVDSDPELNDTWQTATSLQDGVLQNAHLGHYLNQNIYNDNADWFKVVVPEDGKLTFETRSASTLTFGLAELCALKPDGSDVERRNAKWLDNPDSTLIFEIPDVSEGTYYFYMPRRYGYGHYYLTYYFTSHKDAADPEPNDSWETATVLKSGPGVTGQLGYDYKNTKDVADWYQLDVPEEGAINLTILSEETLTIGMAEIKVPNADGTDTNRRTAQWLDNPGDTLTMTLPNCAPGKYYLYLPQRAGYGTYYLRYNFTPCSKQADAEPNDEFTKAAEMPEGVTTEARLGYDYSNSLDNKDWFKLAVPEEGSINLTIQSEKTLTIGMAEIKVPNADGTDTNRRTAQWLDHPGDTLIMILPNCAAGTYYLYMPQRAGYGGYTVKYDFVPCSKQADAEPNDEFAEAAEMPEGAITEARLGYDYSNSLDNKDWFKLAVPEEGSINLTIQSEKTLTIGMAEIKVPNADGTDTNRRTAQWLDHPGDTLIMILPNCAAGTYYLYMPQRAGYGGYTVKYDFIPCVYANDVADNDTQDAAMPIENGTITQARLGYDYSDSMDNKDWFEFTLTADGGATFTIQSEKTLTLGMAEILEPKADGTGTSRRNAMWLDKPGDTLVFKADNLAAGTYYLYMPHRAGYGGYSVKSDFTKNPYYREALANIDFANRMELKQGASVYGTMGYEYQGTTQSEAWFDLGMMHGTQIDVNVEVESSHSLSIGVATLYKYTGDKDDGSPILQKVTDKRLERSSGTISYLDKETEDSHYIFYLPRYNGYGGYKVTLGEEADESISPVLASGYDGLRVMMDGRNTLRKGVPCENTITIANMSDKPSLPSSLVLSGTDNINIIGFRMPTDKGTVYYSAEEVLVEGEGCENTAVFYVPDLAPWETYTFTMIAEGKGDIAYAPFRIDEEGNLVPVDTETASRRKIEPITTALILGFIIDVEWDIIEDKLGIDHFYSRVAGEVMKLDEEEERQYCQVMGLTRQQMREEQPSTGAYVAKAVVKRACVNAIEKIPVVGKVITSIGNGLEIMQNIVPNLRRRLWLWIYKDLGYVKDDLEVKDGKRGINDVVASWDPNEMVGPAGVGEKHYISGETQTVNYTILFENKAEAGDAAYRVRVSDALDENVFDVSTVKFGETSHEGVGYNWKMTREGNKLSWDIEGIELPPNVNAPEGEGYVTFSVDLKPGLPHGTAVKNKATIIFDKNFPIETNEFVNTIDCEAPVTALRHVGYAADLQTVEVFCNSNDDSGVVSYQLFVSKDGGEYTYEGQFPGTALYPVAPGDESTYRFYVLATDGVGNTESVAPEALTFNYATGIDIVNAEPKSIPADGKVYSIDGRYIGTLGVGGFTMDALNKGIYIVGGKRVMVK